MPVLQRIEVRLSLLMVLVVVATSLITIALNTYQRERVFRELPSELRDFLRRNEGRPPSLSLTPELRSLLSEGRELRVRQVPSSNPDNPSPIFLIAPLDDPAAAPVQIQPPSRLRRPSLEARIQQNLLIASLVATALGVLVALVDVASGGVGLLHQLVYPLNLFARLPHDKSARDVATVTVDGNSEIEQQQLARLNHALSGGGVRQSRIRPRLDQRIEGQSLRAALQ